MKKEFCIECLKEVNYTLCKKIVNKTIKGKEYSFKITVAICDECKNQLSINYLIDLNNKEIDEQYRKIEEIVSIEDIVKLMNIYDIGKAPLSLVLGFGEITITRYLNGQIPSKEYSEVIKKALSSPSYMKELLINNKKKINEVAYNKTYAKIIELETLFNNGISIKMLNTIEYIFNSLKEVTPLMLQKLLYFVNGMSFIYDDDGIFNDRCEAWVHGPVYPKVYNLFKDFKYNPIHDDRFIILKEMVNILNEEEMELIDLVLDTFGNYSSKILEKITHNEKPWIEARKYLDDDIKSNEIIDNDILCDYFRNMNNIYDLRNKKGICTYINDKLK